MISKKEVQHVAKLARLNITTQEEEKFSKELSSILDYVEKLKELKVAKVESTSHPLEVENVLREDNISDKEKINKRLMEAAPDKKGDYVKVKKILKISNS